MAKPGALANIDLDLIVARIGAGEFQSHIARELGVEPPSLHRLISQHPEYRLALRCRNERKLDDAQAALDDEQSNLARARERFKAAAWRASVECPGEWGQRAEISVQIDLGAALRELSERLQRRQIDPAAQQLSIEVNSGD